MAGLAHESRNALQRIQASAEVLELEVEDNADAMKMIQQIQLAQDDLNHIFDEVRGYAAPVVLDRHEFAVSDLWREAWSQLAAQRQSRDAELSESVSVSSELLHADHFRLVQVFRNCIENSLAACKDAARIDVTCEDALIESKPAFQIEVSDNGGGIPTDQLENVFSPFYTTKSQGTGLGMAIAHRTVEAHGGTISMGASDSGGAKVSILLPR